MDDQATEAGTCAALNALQRLFQDCSEFSREADALRWRVGNSDSGVRLEGRASAIAAALCKTCHVLRVGGHLMNSDIPLRSSDALEKLASWINEDVTKVSPAAFARLRELEVLGLFAIHLVEAVKARHLKDFSWRPRRPEVSFIAAWCRQHDADGALFLRIRPRIDEVGVARLIRRYRTHCMASEDDDAVAKA
jgi:hypothetical protein